MRHSLIPLAAFLCLAVPAVAQVTVDLRALDQLPSAGPGVSHPTIAPIQREAPRPKVTLEPKTATVPAKPAPQPPPVEISAAPPPLPAGVAPPATVVAAPSTPSAPPPAPAPPPPAQVASLGTPPGAPASPPPAKPAMASVRIPFTGDQSDLSAEAAAAIKGLVDSAPTADTSSYNVMAYAGGSPDDPSASRRVSLSRALAARSALMGDGIPSSRIYVRALGAQAGNGPADRVDISVLGGNAAASK